MNVYDNSNIDCIICIICIIILFLINSFIVINTKKFFSLVIINRVILLLIHVTTKSSAKLVDRQLSYVLKN